MILDVSFRKMGSGLEKWGQVLILDVSFDGPIKVQDLTPVFDPGFTIMTSGHPMYVIRLADHYTRLILEYDKKLSERKFVNSLYYAGNKPYPKKFNLDWHIEGLDLGILDKKNNLLFSIQQGHL